MIHVAERTVSLDALSDRQRRAVARHLPLVNRTLDRLRLKPARGCAPRERAELFQEACLALVESFRTHDPAVHGRFAPFAMARMHFAVSRFLHEQSFLLRVPFITQRRRKMRSSRESVAPEEPIPRVRTSARIAAAVHRRRCSKPVVDERIPSLGDVFRDRYDAALELAIADETPEAANPPDSADLLHRCYDERWTVPDPECQTPMRRMARELNCSLGKITHCEARVRRRIARRLKNDPRFDGLIREARRHPLGWNHRPD